MIAAGARPTIHGIVFQGFEARDFLSGKFAHAHIGGTLSQSRSASKDEPG